MSRETIVNDLSTTLDGTITSGATTITLADVTGVPDVPTRIRIENEYLLITARTGTSCTVTRGVEGSTPAAHSSGATVTFVATNTFFLRNFPRTYNVRGYGALGDGKVVSDAAMTSGSGTLTSATGLFLSTDVGKKISVQGAGAAGAVLNTTISGYTSATQVTLTASASTTVSSKQAVWATNDTTAFQDAIDAAYAAGGGTVFVPDGLYGLNSGIVLKSGVTLRTLSGTAPDPGNITGGITGYKAGVLMLRSTTDYGVTLSGSAMALKGLAFWYPDQVVPTASTPTSYPATICNGAYSAAGVSIDHCAIINAYDGIILGTASTQGIGRVDIQANLIGAYHTAAEFDHGYDVIEWHTNYVTHVWDFGAYSYPQTIDTWAQANGNGVIWRRADDPHMTGGVIIHKNQAVVFTDSADTLISPRGSAGAMSDVKLDGSNNCIVADSTSPAGWHLSNVSMLDNGSGNATVTLGAGGTAAPNIRMTNCFIAGSNAYGVDLSEGSLSMVECEHYNKRSTAGVRVASAADYFSMIGNRFIGTGGAGVGLDIANSWAGRCVLIGNDLNTQTYTAPATLPTTYRVAQNVGITITRRIPLRIQTYSIASGTPDFALRGSSANWYEKQQAWAFDGAADEAIIGTEHLPANYVAGGTLSVILEHAPSSGAAGNVLWGVVCEYTGTGEQIDAALSSVNTTGTSAMPAVAEQSVFKTFSSLTAPSAGADSLRIGIWRWGSSGSDTYDAADVWLYNAYLEYQAES